MPRITGIVAALAFIAAMPAVSRAGDIGLATYLAEYDLSLARQQQDQEIASISGLLVIEFTGSKCVGYTNDGRTVTALETFDGDRILTDSRSRTVEYPDGEMEFFNETFADGDRVEVSSGRANHDTEGVRVDLDEPEERMIVLPGAAVFPTQQVIRVVSAARSEQHFLTMDIYDGSLDGKSVYQTATVIGAAGRGPIDDSEEELIAGSGMSGQVHWPVTISYFEKTDERSDSTPDFVLSFELYENGVGRNLLIDYGKFAMHGRLTSLTMLPQAACN